MSREFAVDADAILNETVTKGPGVPGVVAMVTDRNGNIYEGATGKRRTDKPDAMTTDTSFAIFSTTKAITGTAALQLIEEGQLDLDAPARRYAPDIGKLQVIDGFDAKGQPKLRAPKREVTTRMLLLHIGGFGYDFFNENYLRLATEHGQPSVITASKASIMTPLLFDPGSKWEYGTNIDWVGQVVEGITGKRLGEVFAERIFKPLGMANTTFEINDAVRSKLAGMHARNADGSLTPMDFELPSNPEVHMGGHGLYSTVGDYMRFIRMWLNDGNGPHGRVLKPETVNMAEKNHLGDLKVTALPGVIKSLSNDAEFFPGQSKSWSFTFMVNDEEAPTGRPAGALGWAGLANLFYWIDRQNGFGGYWATQILPFGDPASFTGYMRFETAFYDTLHRRKAA
ncbi:beta-lactamase family protein [Bradyrhizobium sp. ISRA443]|uniref:serine hydrolase domain-containing protein n=1 Tax=unclassified Bradyrhizobium TaxID=2631580 RepID=UPI00247A31D8|nr:MULTISPECIES: serine hydrolase domain-containing protein [unclassified Bradyrhizobium]WGR96543.1 beta-lactamase family protein [Bradyrhizobium sp. ISRA436]WGS03430.1 beta-lactamase family protein [Bradyrhizobium sp. ISRA437]WGS10314.1 beta-lactamase family protein [Bradyrhizobium sp. ISRA443]